MDYLMLQQPAPTQPYMIAGFIVIFGMMGAYIMSLIIRRRNLKAQITIVQEILAAQEKD